jgi:uncharacterized membrane protein
MRAAARLQYLDWLRGLAVVAMVLAHVSDSWTLDAGRRHQGWYTVAFVGGVASPLFLFLAGVAMAMSAASRGRAAAAHAERPPGSAAGSTHAHRAGARHARRRGWEIFVLGWLFRVQSQVLGFGPLSNLLKVDMLNLMGVSMVAATYLWQLSPARTTRLALLGAATAFVAMITPIVRDVPWLSALPDPLEAYLRPAGSYAAFPFFPWAGFLFAGVIVGDLVDAVRTAAARGGALAATPISIPSRDLLLQNGLAIAGGAGVALAWLASFQPSIYASASFWHDSPTFFFIRLGLVTLLVPLAWVLERLFPDVLVGPLATLGRSSLFVYWVHVEMVYGVWAEPIKRTMPLWLALTATALVSVAMYGLVVLKNRRFAGRDWRGPWRILAPILR